MFSAGAGVFFPEPEFFWPEPEPEPEVKNPEFAQHYTKHSDFKNPTRDKLNACYISCFQMITDGI